MYLLSLKKSITQVEAPKEEKKKNVSTTTITLPQITKVKPTQKNKRTEDKTTIKNVSEPTKPVEETMVQTIEQTTRSKR